MYRNMQYLGMSYRLLTCITCEASLALKGLEVDSAALNLSLGAMTRGQAWRRSYETLGWAAQRGLRRDALSFASLLGLTLGPRGEKEAWPMALSTLRGKSFNFMS